MLISYNWLKSYIKDLPKEDELAQKITFSLCEVEGVEKKDNGDTILDLNILPDRAHDLLCHKGVATELAGLLGLDFVNRDYKLPVNLNKTKLEVEIETDKCSRYIGRIVRGVKVGPSPSWMVEYLASIGQRSINNIVDATNIVLFDIGQPIHAFDLNKLESEKIVVRNAKDGETLSLVGREKLEAKLKITDMVITDGVKSLAVAGVKGGLDSGVEDNTKDILIEVANFNAVSVRKTARRLGILTDASKRYENEIPASLCDEAMDEITALLYEIFPKASFEEVVDNYKEKENERHLSFEGEYISKVLGVVIGDNEIEEILKKYKYEYKKDGSKFDIKIPERRLDIKGPHDMAEEIGRVYGYENIPPLLPKISQSIEDNSNWVKIKIAKEKLLKDGYREVMTHVFTNSGDVEILASASDKNFLRTNISDGLKKSYEMNKLNAPLLNILDLKIFEVGAVFKHNQEVINVCFMDKKNITEVSLDEFCKNIEGEVVDIEYHNLSKTFKPWSIYPFMVRDIAVWVPVENQGENGVTNKEKLAKIYKEFGADILNGEPILFDEFTKGDKTSIAYRLIFQSYVKTLTDDEVNSVMTKINTKISELGWEVR